MSAANIGANGCVMVQRVEIDLWPNLHFLSSIQIDCVAIPDLRIKDSQLFRMKGVLPLTATACIL